MQNGQEQAGYQSDAVDNLVEIRQGNSTKNLIPNSLNQIDRIDSQSYQYDANGNLLNDGQRNYLWDAADRLIQITDLATGVSSEFTYDGYSRRIKETEKDASGNITKQLNNLWCGETLCAQQDKNGQTINRFFAQGEVQNGQAYLYAQDQVGSVYALIDSQGNVVGRTAYDPYGNITYQTGTQPIMAYAGLYKHDASGLHLATYRAYNPATARWFNRDPIREAGGLNIYAYVEGDPVNFVDSLGLYRMCHRSLQSELPYARHCYIKFNDDSTSSYDFTGVSADPAPNKKETVCTSSKEVEKDKCIKEAMENCESTNYSFTKFNCCHCAEQAMKACGASIPRKEWPNWPINPGPQLGEKGYVDEPVYNSTLGE